MFSKFQIYRNKFHSPSEHLDEFLKLLRLEEYRDCLISQNYRSTMDALQLSWDDLEDIGIVKLGHQKRLLLGIKRISDLKNGKKIYPPNLNVVQTRVCVENRASASSPSCSATSPSFSDFDFPQRSYHSFNGNWECPNDIVPIKVRNERGKSLESLKDAESENLTSSFVGNVTSVISPSKVMENGPWKLRSFEDGDVTPTNEAFSGGTLPRPRSLVKPRPVAMIPANVCSTYKTQEYILDNDALKKPPCPPKRDTMVHVMADFHCAQTPPEPAPSTPPWKLEERKLIHSLKSNHGSDSSFHSNSSADSDSMPFANDNAGTIKQKSVKFACDYPPTNIVSPQSTKKSSLKFPSQKQDPIDVLDDIGNMLANLTDELDAMLEEEKRQGLIQD